MKSKVNNFENRRSFMQGSLAAGMALASASALSATEYSNHELNSGDTAILRFLAAAELIESDLWQQYAELGGVTQ